MNQTAETLQEIYSGASMGERGSELMIGKVVEDGHLSAQLHQFANQYMGIKNEAADKLSAMGEKPKEPGKMEQAGQWMGVQMNTMLDKSSSHLAEMLIQGSTMGVIKGEKDKRQHRDASPEARELESKLIRLDQEYIEAMKLFLN